MFWWMAYVLLRICLSARNTNPLNIPRIKRSLFNNTGVSGGCRNSWASWERGQESLSGAFLFATTFLFLDQVFLLPLGLGMHRISGCLDTSINSVWLYTSKYSDWECFRLLIYILESKTATGSAQFMGWFACACFSFLAQSAPARKGETVVWYKITKVSLFIRKLVWAFQKDVCLGKHPSTSVWGEPVDMSLVFPT